MLALAPRQATPASGITQQPVLFLFTLPALPSHSLSTDSAWILFSLARNNRISSGKTRPARADFCGLRAIIIAHGIMFTRVIAFYYNGNTIIIQRCITVIVDIYTIQLVIIYVYIYAHLFI